MEDEDEDCLQREKWVLIMADFGAEGVWDKRGYSREPESLPISADLMARIYTWQAWYDRECTNYLPVNELDVVAFAAEGLAIARAVKAELSDWTVIYFDEAGLAQARLQSSTLQLDARDRGKFEYEINSAG